MTGLEFILVLYRYNNLELAQMLDIHGANITMWLKNERKIPEKHKEKLSEFFKIPKHLLQNELTDQDKRRIVIENIKILAEEYKIKVILDEHDEN